jgi:hypothetical protein
MQMDMLTWIVQCSGFNVQRLAFWVEKIHQTARIKTIKNDKIP